VAELHRCCVVDLFGVFWTGPKDLLVGHRISWGILLQTPVFSLRSARCRGRASSLLCRSPLDSPRPVRPSLHFSPIQDVDLDTQQ
jgi:hypothetical protein